MVSRPVQRFWSTLAVQVGKRAGLVSVIGLLVTLALGAGITQARVRHRAGLVPEQERSGLQGQRRLPGPLRRPGDAHPHLDGRGGDGSRSSSSPRTARQIDEAIKSLRDSGQVLGVIGPTTALRVQRQPRDERGREPAQLGGAPARSPARPSGRPRRTRRPARTTSGSRPSGCSPSRPTSRTSTTRSG